MQEFARESSFLKQQSKEKKQMASPAQQEAIYFRDGAMLVVAGPGSGKTYVITQRIKYLIERQAIPPSQILVITFTKEAAMQMQKRAIRLCGRAGQVRFGTFHSVFYEILRNSQTYQNYSILSNFEKTQILTKILRKYPLDHSQIHTQMEKLMTEMSYCKNTGIVSMSEDISRQAMEAYNRECRLSWKMDFDDILQYCKEVLTKEYRLREEWQSRFRYILIDEFQDINALQYQICQIIAAKHRNLFVVGDDDQSIYSFRGSNPAFMKQFLVDYEEAKQVYLTTNYRCGENILQLAKKTISINKNRFEKDMNSGNESMGDATIRRCMSLEDEKKYVLEEIQRIQRREIENEIIAKVEIENNPQIALLVRTNSEMEKWIHAFQKNHILYNCKEKIKSFYQKEYIKDVMAYLRFVFCGNKRCDFLQIMNKPMRYIARDSLKSEIVSLEQLFLEAKERDEETYAGELIILIQELDMLSGLSPFAAIQFILHRMGYLEYLRETTDKDTFEDAQKNLNELLERCASYKSSIQFLKEVEEYERELANGERKMTNTYQTGKCEDISLVQLFTYHGSKGLEFDAVFLPGLNDGKVPHGKKMTQEILEEERRMFYVAQTRAKKILRLSYVQKSQEDDQVQSLFIKELHLK